MNSITRKFLLVSFAALVGTSQSLASPYCKQLQNPLCIFKLLEKQEFVKSVRLQNPSPEKGRYLTVLYVVGEKPPIILDDRQIQVKDVKYVVPSILVTDDPIVLP